MADKVKILTKDAFRELGDAFNIVTEDLGHSKEGVRRKEHTALLGRIASGLVHDLRHPIKNLENSSRLMTRFYDDRKTRELFKGIVDREIPNLNRLLDNLLHLSKSSQIEPTLFSLHPLVTELLESLRSDSRCFILGTKEAQTGANNNKKVVISIEIEPQDLKIWADRFALERVLRNLTTNAIEAMPRGGKLSIGAKSISVESSSQEGTAITISDTGCGISPDRLEHLFVDYTTTKQKSIGLGLAICKKIIEEHEAKIYVKSKTDSGTTFAIKFPFQK